MKKRIAMCGVLMLGGVLMFLFVSYRNRYKDLTANTDFIAYTEKLLNIEWQDCIETAVGDVKVADWEEFANIKLKVKEGAEEKVISILKNGCGQSLDFSSHTIPGYQGHELAKELKNSDIQSIWSISMEGRRVKTKNVYIYMTLDDEGDMYVYIFLV
ncbi:MAG: hypothetical protein K2N01_03200 [Lachnospiraceae bacterium]|nr:hypothetical protein [Lachnospiraceae bacterium]